MGKETTTWLAHMTLFCAVSVAASAWSQLHLNKEYGSFSFCISGLQKLVAVASPGSTSRFFNAPEGCSSKDFAVAQVGSSEGKQ